MLISGHWADQLQLQHQCNWDHQEEGNKKRQSCRHYIKEWSAMCWWCTRHLHRQTWKCSSLFFVVFSSVADTQSRRQMRQPQTGINKGISADNCKRVKLKYALAKKDAWWSQLPNILMMIKLMLVDAFLRCFLYILNPLKHPFPLFTLTLCSLQMSAHLMMVTSVCSLIRSSATKGTQSYF